MTPPDRDSGRASKSGAGEDTIDMGMLTDSVGYNLRCAQVVMFQDFNRSLGHTEITPPQFGALILINANPGISQSRVARTLRFDRSTLVQIIDRLEERGLVVREVSAHDRRSHALKLTADGARMLTEIETLALDHEAKVTSALSSGDKRTLTALLQKIYRPDDS